MAEIRYYTKAYKSSSIMRKRSRTDGLSLTLSTRWRNRNNGYEAGYYHRQDRDTDNDWLNLAHVARYLHYGHWMK